MRKPAGTELLEPSTLGSAFVVIGDGGRPPTAPMALSSSISVWDRVVTGTSLVAAVIFSAQVVSRLIANGIFELNGQMRSV